MAIRIALAQFNATVGDIVGNVGTMRRLYAEALKAKVDLLVFPEMCVCGYPPEDLLYKEHFLADNVEAVERLAADCPKIVIIAGFPEMNEQACFNSLAVLKDGKISRIYRKTALPNYGVFDEQRYFQPGTKAGVIDIKGFAIVLTICEDIWQIEKLDKLLKDTPDKDIIINISASPFHAGKLDRRCEVFSSCARHFKCALAYCNLLGGQDELVFDGRSMFFDSAGRVVSRAESFAEDMLIADIQPGDGTPATIANVKAAAEFPETASVDAVSEVYDALVLGTRDYVRKNGFAKVVIGLSGGIDSSLTAAIAVDALGAQNVVGVTMPSRFNSTETINDAENTAANMGIEFHTVPIAGILEKFDKTLGIVKGWSDDGIAYENLQARIRGGILMSLSNQFGYMVLTTGNKSETAVGYSTLYGDTAGGFAVIKDVPKTFVYKLSEYVNKLHGKELIPVTVITRPPSAELRENQKDTDSLPDYDLLDKILTGYIQEDRSVGQLCSQGLTEDVVSRVVRLVDRNEYKRRQSPPGVKITPKSFGKDRRMPITNRYTSS